MDKVVVMFDLMFYAGVGFTFYASNDSFKNNRENVSRNQ